MFTYACVNIMFFVMFATRRENMFTEVVTFAQSYLVTVVFLERFKVMSSI